MSLAVAETQEADPQGHGSRQGHQAHLSPAPGNFPGFGNNGF